MTFSTRRSKSRKKKKKSYVCYDGVGSKKKNHTRKEFMKIMNRTSKILWKNKYLHKKFCSEYFASKKCKFCKKYIKNLNHMIRKSKNPNYKPSENKSKKNAKLFLRCLKCKEASKKICSFEDFLKYSGASKGKCRK